MRSLVDCFCCWQFERSDVNETVCSSIGGNIQLFVFKTQCSLDSFKADLGKVCLPLDIRIDQRLRLGDGCEPHGLLDERA